jgi:hypothetical protein
MININTPEQNWLFDSDRMYYSDLAMRRLGEDWPSIFRMCILELMPVDEVGKSFSKIMGRPTKELYSASGLMLLMEFNDWTVEEAADAYMFDSRVHFALNLGRDCQSMSTRTIERYQKIFREKQLAQEIMEKVTRRLIELLDIKTDQLRLDSTHVFSNMARYGRTRLMMTVTRNFLIQLRRHDAKSYYSLSSELRDRYDKKNWEFGKKGGSIPAREDIAIDMNFLISTYETNDHINNRTTFKTLVRTFNEQCEIVENKVKVRKKTGNRTLQNPSDPDATFDAHKGSGYQVQATETCSDENDTQIIVNAIPETACEPDQYAVEKLVKYLDSMDIKPETISGDTHYGTDNNHQFCMEKGINLVAPVLQGKQTKGRIDLSQFNIDRNGVVQSCPEGVAPISAWFDPFKGKGSAIFACKTCCCCPNKDLCQVKRNGKNYNTYYDARTLRIARRKLEMQKPETASIYAKRSGIEATFSEGKKVTGLGQLRVRGQAAVYNAILLKITGINIRRAAKSNIIRDMFWGKVAMKAVFHFKSQLHIFLNSFNAYIRLFTYFRGTI